MNHAVLLFGAELRRIVRAPMLLVFCVMGLIIPVLFRFLWPEVVALARLWAGADWSGYGILVLAVLLQMPASMIGVAVGFLILEDRDDGIFGPLSVSPVRIQGYLAGRVGIFTVLCFLECCAVPFLFGTLPQSDHWAGILAAALSASSLTAAYAFMIGALARNKVEGMSVGKAFSLLDAGALLAWFATGWWPALAWLVPTFAPAKTVLAPWPEALAWMVLALAWNALVLMLSWRVCRLRAIRAGGF